MKGWTQGNYINFSVISLCQYEEEGYTIAKNLLNEEELEEGRKALQQLIERYADLRPNIPISQLAHNVVSTFKQRYGR